MKYLPVIMTLLFVTYGQLIIKYEINKMGTLPTDGLREVVGYFLRAITNIGIMSGLIAAFIASLSWMAAMSRFELSSVYPFLSLNFIIVPLLSIIIFSETFNLTKVIGIIVIVAGVLIFSQGIE